MDASCNSLLKSPIITKPLTSASSLTVATTFQFEPVKQLLDDTIRIYYGIYNELQVVQYQSLAKLTIAHEDNQRINNISYFFYKLVSKTTTDLLNSSLYILSASR